MLEIPQEDLHYITRDAAALRNHAAMEVLLASRATIDLFGFCRISTLHYAVENRACVKMAIEA